MEFSSAKLGGAVISVPPMKRGMAFLIQLLYRDMETAPRLVPFLHDFETLNALADPKIRIAAHKFTTENFIVATQANSPACLSFNMVFYDDDDDDDDDAINHLLPYLLT